MKKVLLSMLALGATAFGSMAATTTIDFSGTENLYGMTRYNVTSSMTYSLGTFSGVVPDLSIQDGPVEVTFKKLDANGGFALINQTKNNGFEYNKGLVLIGASQPAKKTKPEVTITVPGGKITNVTFNISGPTGPASATNKEFQINGQQITTSGSATGCTLT